MGGVAKLRSDALYLSSHALYHLNFMHICVELVK